MKIAVVGLGKLGAVIAALYADAGHQVTGVDINATVVNTINSHNSPYGEPGLQGLIERVAPNLHATTDFAYAIESSDIAILVLPTPSAPDGTFSNSYVLSAIELIANSVKDRDRYLIILASTVSPGTCNEQIIPLIETSSGKRVGSEIGLVYSPEFIALGSIINDMKNPDMVLLGMSDEESGNIAQEIIGTVVKSAPKFFRMSLTSAEIAKLAVNTFVTTKISYANMIGELCSLLHDASANDVLEAIGADSRIGSKYLKSALGYGGPCFPRDNRALQAFALAHGSTAPLALATDAINARQVDLLVSNITRRVPLGKTVAVLGLSYKPFTPVCEESQGVLVANSLFLLGYRVRAHDPQALSNAKQHLEEGVDCVDELLDAIDSVHTVVVTTPWPEYASVRFVLGSEIEIVDPWNVVQPLSFNNH